MQDGIERFHRSRVILKRGTATRSLSLSRRRAARRSMSGGIVLDGHAAAWSGSGNLAQAAPYQKLAAPSAAKIATERPRAPAPGSRAKKTRIAF
jgi:hypothetical protein